MHKILRLLLLQQLFDLCCGCPTKKRKFRVSMDASSVVLLTSAPTDEDSNMPNRLEFTIPEDRWGLRKPGVILADTLGVPMSKPDDLEIVENPDVPNTAIKEVRLDVDNGTLTVATIDDGVRGGYGEYLIKGRGQIGAIVAVTLSDVTGFTVTSDNSPVEVLLTDPDAAPAG